MGGSAQSQGSIDRHGEIERIGALQWPKHLSRRLSAPFKGRWPERPSSCGAGVSPAILVVLNWLGVHDASACSCRELMWRRSHLVGHRAIIDDVTLRVRQKMSSATVHGFARSENAPRQIAHPNAGDAGGCKINASKSYMNRPQRSTRIHRMIRRMIHRTAAT